MPIGKSNGAVVDQGTAVRTLLTPVQPAEPTNGKYIDAGDAKSTRILRQGIYQAVIQSPGIAGLQYANAEQLMAHVQSIAEKIITLVEGK